MNSPPGPISPALQEILSTSFPSSEEEVAEVDADISRLVGESPSEATAPSRRPTLRQQIDAKNARKKDKERAQRVEALKKMGVAEDQIPQVLAQQEYQELPIDQKLARLEAMVAQMGRGLSSEIMNLHHNDVEVADAMDANFRAIGKALEKLGLSKADQITIITETTAEVAAEKRARYAAQQAQQEHAQERETANDIKEVLDTVGEPAAAPEEATQFGG